MRILTEDERTEILSLWPAFISAVAIYFLTGSFWKAVLIGAFVGGSAVLGYGRRWLLNGSVALAVLAIAVALDAWNSRSMLLDAMYPPDHDKAYILRIEALRALEGERVRAL